MGPAPPPAPLNQLPAQPAEEQEDDSSSDDEWGPSLPTGDAPSTVSHDMYIILNMTDPHSQNTTRNQIIVLPSMVATPKMRTKDYNETTG